MTLLWSNPLEDGEERMVETALSLLGGSGLHIRPDTGKIGGLFKAASADTPWIHFKHTTIRHCQIWNKIYCRQYKIVPHMCKYHCWKTVIKPRTVVELFHLHDLMMSLDYPSKCGIDVRDYTPGPYAGFVYGDSLKEGQEYYRLMRHHVSEAISPYIPVILKRGCTEMEAMYPSDQWDSLNHEHIERKLDDIFIKEEADGKQSDWVKNHIRRKWLRHAMSIGDETWKELAEGVKGMHPHVVHYESKEAFEQTKSIKDPVIGQEV